MLKVVYKVFRRTLNRVELTMMDAKRPTRSTTRGERTADALSDAAVLSARRNGFF